MKAKYLYDVELYLIEKNFNNKYKFLKRQIKAIELLRFNADIKGGVVTNWNAPEFESIRLDMVKDFKNKQKEKLSSFSRK